ncbi:MAG: hypothetical protein MUQ56_09760, partial [Thermoleophilia bacterium]|nr:hypothetical protein [Thermoleophilia bacterium]
MRMIPRILLASLLLAAAVCAAAPADDTTAPIKLTTTDTFLAAIHTGNLTGSPRIVASPDNRHEAHPVGRFAKGMVMATDGQASGPTLQGFYNGTLTWSPDSKHTAFLAGAPQKHARCSVVLDGVEQKQYDGVLAPLVFSPNGAHLAYLAKKGKLWLAVVDGVEGKEYEDVSGPIAFDAEGKRVAYSAKVEGRCFVVADGQEGERYELAVGPIIRPDGTRLAYAAKGGGTSFAVLDGQRQKEYDGISSESLVFSPDGKHFAYGVRRGDLWLA